MESESITLLSAHFGVNTPRRPEGSRRDARPNDRSRFGGDHGAHGSGSFSAGSADQRDRSRDLFEDRRPAALYFPSGLVAGAGHGMGHARRDLQSPTFPAVS